MGLQNIHFPLMVMFGCQGASAQSRLKKVVSHLDVLRFNFALSDQATTLPTSGCEDATIMSSVRDISIGTHKGLLLKHSQEIVYVDCVMEGDMTETWVRPSLKVLEGPMGLFSRSLAVRFMSQEDRHSVK